MFRNAFGFVVCLTLVLFSVQSFAQVELKPGIGLTLTSVSKDPEGGESKARVGWQIGGTALFGDKFFGEVGAFYTKKNPEITSVTSDLDINGISGIQIPAMVGFHLLGSENAALALRAFGGGTLFLVTSVDAAGLLKDDFESPTFGVFAGAGLDIGILFLDLKYEWSLTDVSSLSTIDVGKSRSFFPSAGIRLPF